MSAKPTPQPKPPETVEAPEADHRGFAHFVVRGRQATGKQKCKYPVADRAPHQQAPSQPIPSSPSMPPKFVDSGKRALADVIEIGARLAECKRICGHSNWLPWLDREFGWEETTAQRFMRVHKLAQSKSGKLADLPV